MPDIQLIGDTKLVAKLKKNMQLDLVKKAIRVNGAELQKKAQAKAPVDTGQLKRSIGLEITDGGLTAEVEPGVDYAAYQEYGTRFMNAQPFMRPSLQEQSKQFKQDLERCVK